MPRPEIDDADHPLSAGNGKGSKVAIMRHHYPVFGEGGSQNALIGGSSKVNITGCNNVTPFLPEIPNDVRVNILVSQESALYYLQ